MSTTIGEGILRVAVIGAGVGGLTAAVDLARAGCEVVVLERALTAGGKMRQVQIDGQSLDAGPTVFTLREVFDSLFADCGESLNRHLGLTRAHTLARHAWNADEKLDLFADVERSAEAIGEFAGRREAAGFERFTAHARRIFATLDASYMRASRPSPLQLVRRLGVRGVADLWNVQPFATLWREVGRYFEDPRLRQLFARYATYCGSSPFSAPATLMLIAHVEQTGVWYVTGGMHELARQLAALAQRQGAMVRFGSEVSRIHLRHGRVSEVETLSGERFAVDAIVSNADNNALASGRLGAAVTRSVRATAPRARSLSAVTWNLVARTAGFELAHHSIFFCTHYRAEFDDIFRRSKIPNAPTIYICAQDRGNNPCAIAQQPERLLCLINAPPVGDTHLFDREEISKCETRVFELLSRFGLTVHRQAMSTIATSPTDFSRLFPGTGGALYGPASHGWLASFKRAGANSRIPGLYLAGGSTHPGPGVPMAATSGRLAAAAILRDRGSTRP